MADDTEVTWKCKIDPFDGYHEFGCPHLVWTNAQLVQALKNTKRKIGEQEKSLKLWREGCVLKGVCAGMEKMREVEKFTDAEAQDMALTLQDVAAAAGYCVRKEGHEGPCNGLPRNSCISR